MFKAIGRDDRTSLRTLSKTFIEKGENIAALLCLHPVFSSPPELRNLPLAQVQTWLSFYLRYICLLNELLCDESLALGSNRQRLFGFQVLGEGRCLVPRYTLLHEKFTNQSGPSGEGVENYRCGYDELDLGIVQIIKSRIRGRTEIQNNACHDAHGFSPCPYLLVQNRCNPPEGKGPCPFQHVQLKQLTVDWHRARLRLILLQFQILDSARCYRFHLAMYVSACSTRISCGHSSNVKLLAWDVALSTSSAFSESRIARDS